MAVMQLGRCEVPKDDLGLLMIDEVEAADMEVVRPPLCPTEIVAGSLLTVDLVSLCRPG